MTLLPPLRTRLQTQVLVRPEFGIMNSPLATAVPFRPMCRLLFYAVDAASPNP